MASFRDHRGSFFLIQQMDELGMTLDVGFRVGAIRHDFPTESAGFQKCVLRDACGDAFSTKCRWHKGVLDDDFVSILTVGNDGWLAGTGSQFKALLAWKMDGFVGHG